MAWIARADSTAGSPDLPTICCAPDQGADLEQQAARLPQCADAGDISPIVAHGSARPTAVATTQAVAGDRGRGAVVAPIVDEDPAAVCCFGERGGIALAGVDQEGQRQPSSERPATYFALPRSSPAGKAVECTFT